MTFCVQVADQQKLTSLNYRSCHLGGLLKVLPSTYFLTYILPSERSRHWRRRRTHQIPDSVQLTANMTDAQPALPAIPGLKLAPLTPTVPANIKFLVNLGHTKDKDGYFWKVETEDKGTFALKLFSFMHWVTTLRDSWAVFLARPLQTPQLYYDCFLPSNAECRVYGRLKEENQEDLAVKASGYLELTEDVPQMWEDLQGLQRLGIYESRYTPAHLRRREACGLWQGMDNVPPMS